MCENIEIGVAESSGIYSTTIDSTTTDEGEYSTPNDTTLDMGTTTDEGGYTPPTDPTPDIGSSTDDDGIHDDPENPSGDINDSTKTSTTCKPVVVLEEPSRSYTVWVKEGESATITITAKGSNCVKMTAYVNGTIVGTSNGNSLSCSYTANKADLYTVTVVGTSSTSHTASASRTVTVKDRYTVMYDLNGGMGDTPASQIVKVGEHVALAIIANLKDCYMFDHTFDGWGYYSENGIALLGQGTTTQFNSDVTLHAQFTRVVER